MSEEEKCYIVVEDCWEYNDGDYYQPEDEPYTLAQPKLFTLAEATQLRDSLNEKCTLTNVEWDGEDEVETPIYPYKIIKLQI